MPVLLTPIRDDNAYYGVAKQSSGGTPVAPTVFPRWHDGSNIQLDAKMEDVWEGDGSRHLSRIIKNHQEVKGKLVFCTRPNELGLFEVAAQGIGADAYAAPAVNTTLSAATTVGATTFTVAANAGLTGTGTVALVLDAGLATEEFVQCTLPATGAGPYTLTVASGGSLKLAHASGATVQAPAVHVITDQTDGNYYTFEVSLGGTAGIILRVRDCKVDGRKVSSKAGGLLMYEVDWHGIATVVQATPATVTLDPHSPFLFTQGVWTLDGSTSGDALAIEGFDIQQKNNLDVSIQTEQLVLAAIIFGNETLDVGLTLVMQNAQRIASTYFGGPTGTTDAQSVASGSVQVVFTQPDGFHTVRYNVPSLVYTKTEPPAPKKDGKAFKLAVSASSTSSMGTSPYLLQTTVQNTTYAAH